MNMIYAKVKRHVYILSELKYAILALIIICLSGCSLGAIKKAQSLLPGKSVVVLPILSDKFNVQHTGTTVFSNWQYYHSVPEWEINRYIVATVKDLIRTRGKVNLLDIDISKIQASAIRDDRFLAAITGIGFSNKQKNKDMLSSLGKKAKADYIIVISPIGSEDVYFGSNAYIKPGYGFYQKTTFGIKRALLYAGIEMAVIDALTGDHVASTYMFNHSSLSVSGYEENDPLIEEKINRDKPIIFEHIKNALELELHELGMLSSNW